MKNANKRNFCNRSIHSIIICAWRSSIPLIFYRLNICFSRCRWIHRNLLSIEPSQIFTSWPKYIFCFIPKTGLWKCHKFCPVCLQQTRHFFWLFFLFLIWVIYGQFLYSKWHFYSPLFRRKYGLHSLILRE